MTTLLTTDLQLDPVLCEQARQLGGHATLTETLQKALEAYIKQLPAKIPGESQLEALLAILEETGRVDYYDDYDYKQLRKMR